MLGTRGTKGANGNKTDVGQLAFCLCYDEVVRPSREARRQHSPQNLHTKLHRAAALGLAGPGLGLADNIVTSRVDGEGLQVKLIDFEFSLSPGSSTDDVVCCGTPGYRAPECAQAARDQDYTAVLRNGGAADVFAAGLVLLEELLDIQYLYEHQRESEALTAYLAQLMAEGLSHKERCDRLASKLKAMRLKCGKRPPVVLLGEEAGAMALDLVHKLTQHSVPARYTAAQALSHPFVARAGAHRCISL